MSHFYVYIRFPVALPMKFAKSKTAPKNKMLIMLLLNINKQQQKRKETQVHCIITIINKNYHHGGTADSIRPYCYNLYFKFKA